MYPGAENYLRRDDLQVRQTLEGRLAVASEEIASAEKEKLEKEALACEALQEQEVLMNALVEESKKLQQEAEENTKVLVLHKCFVCMEYIYIYIY